jgi:hypothetical protein
MPRTAAWRNQNDAQQRQWHAASQSDADAARMRVGQRLLRHAMKPGLRVRKALSREKFVMRNKTVSGAAGILLIAALGWSSAAVAQVQEPIAFIGHGTMFDEAGNPIQATPAFIEKAQTYYLENLSARLHPAQKTTFEAKRARYLDTYKRPSDEGSQAGNKQDTLIINAALIDWLIIEVRFADSGELQGKNNLIKAKLRYRLFPPEAGALYAAPKELLNLLRHQSPDARKN